MPLLGIISNLDVLQGFSAQTMPQGTFGTIAELQLWAAPAQKGRQHASNQSDHASKTNSDFFDSHKNACTDVKSANWITLFAAANCVAVAPSLTTDHTCVCCITHNSVIL